MRVCIPIATARLSLDCPRVRAICSRVCIIVADLCMIRGRIASPDGRNRITDESVGTLLAFLM
jgi:hypothetical protein